ncbi:hypothetical protein J3R30DRAFT_3694763 [Lentinula aciculospora]|uniref:Uncharacterized protein n=1 Tax=Lentinula aciculospora TaxID=153920 RepID=A0A9W9AUJ5_9AGAR|nr:hypothetical protein J3R30DRAFT_3694763 [Lentinula aciculospora]
MPLCKQTSRETSPPPPPPQEELTRKGTLFGRRQRSASPDRSNKSHHTRNSSDSDSVGRAGSTRSGVSLAEESEKAADRALQQARASVIAARDHVKFIKKEAEDEKA